MRIKSPRRTPAGSQKDEKSLSGSKNASPAKPPRKYSNPLPKNTSNCTGHVVQEVPWKN
jgi:hypothetical protein